jgi:hypothetical protein
MGWWVVKTLLTAALIVAISDVARRHERLGGALAALPLVTLLALVWMHLERVPEPKLAAHAWYTFWYVLPTLPMFLAFPALLRRFGFWPALTLCILGTAGLFALYARGLRRWGLEL